VPRPTTLKRVDAVCLLRFLLLQEKSSMVVNNKISKKQRSPSKRGATFDHCRWRRLLLLTSSSLSRGISPQKRGPPKPKATFYCCCRRQSRLLLTLSSSSVSNFSTKKGPFQTKGYFLSLSSSSSAAALDFVVVVKTNLSKKQRIPSKPGATFCRCCWQWLLLLMSLS